MLCYFPLLFLAALAQFLPVDTFSFRRFHLMTLTNKADVLNTIQKKKKMAEKGRERQYGDMEIWSMFIAGFVATYNKQLFVADILLFVTLSLALCVSSMTIHITSRSFLSLTQIRSSKMGVCACSMNQHAGINHWTCLAHFVFFFVFVFSFSNFIYTHYGSMSVRQNWC